VRLGVGYRPDVALRSTATHCGSQVIFGGIPHAIVAPSRESERHAITIGACRSTPHCHCTGLRPSPREGVLVRSSARFCLALLLLLAAEPLFARTAALTLLTASSEPFTAYASGPQNARAGVVLVHDWFGVSPFYTQAAEKLGEQGYRVLAVDLYGGQVATTHDQASKLLQSVRDDLAGREIDGAIAQLAQSGRPVAVMGFSMGAKHALAAALRNPAVHATVLWYGETINDPAKLRQLAGPALLVVGSHDGTSAAENSAAFSKAADAAGQGAEVYVYPGADHAFAQPLFNAGRTYDPVAANAAWLLSQDFLQRRLH
jgi:carboxymethylenebutenolidase